MNDLPTSCPMLMKTGHAHLQHPALHANRPDLPMTLARAVLREVDLRYVIAAIEDTALATVAPSCKIGATEVVVGSTLRSRSY
jgi:hypothetical protein